jgi:hypothetical protein
MRLPVHIWIREENSRPEEVAGYFVQLARYLDEKPQKIRLFVESDVPATLDFNPKDGKPEVSVCGKIHKFDLRHRWLPEHPVPLDFTGKRTVLFIDPVDGNRFRVYLHRRIELFPSWVYAAFSVLAVLTAITLHPVTIIAAIIALTAMILISLYTRIVN